MVLLSFTLLTEMEVAPRFKLFTLLALFKQLWIKKGNYAYNILYGFTFYGCLSKVFVWSG